MYGSSPSPCCCCTSLNPLKIDLAKWQIITVWQSGQNNTEIEFHHITDFHKNWQGCRGPWRNHSVQVWFNIFRGLRSTGGENFRLSIDFAGHRYNSAGATAQPVIIALIVIKIKKTDTLTHHMHDDNSSISVSDNCNVLSLHRRTD